MVGEFEVSAESIKKKQSKGPDVKHHEQVKSVQVTFAKHVKSLCETMEEMGNPSEEGTEGPLMLDTKDIRNIQNIGKKQYASFVESCINDRTESLFNPIKSNKLPL